MKTKKILLSNLTNSKLPDDQLSRLFVGNLNTSQISKKHVLKLFGKFGQIKAISMHRGYAFVQFFHKEHASSAIRKMHGQLVAGQVIDVNLVTEPKPYQKKKLTFTEHGSRASKSIESQPDSQLESSKRSNEPTVREPDSSRESFKRKSSGDSSHSLRLSYLPISVGNSRFPLSHLSNEPHSSRDASHSPPNSIHSSAEASQNLITSSTERTSSSASSRPSYLHNSTNQARKVARQPAQQLQQPTAKQLQPMAKLSYPNSPYLNSFEALMSSIYQQHARSNQPSHYPSNQPNVYLQTSGQQPTGCDLVVCGTCKRVFYSFSIFLQHKQAMCLPTADLCIANAR